MCRSAETIKSLRLFDGSGPCMMAGPIARRRCPLYTTKLRQFLCYPSIPSPDQSDLFFELYAGMSQTSSHGDLKWLRLYVSSLACGLEWLPHEEQWLSLGELTHHPTRRQLGSISDDGLIKVCMPSSHPPIPQPGLLERRVVSRYKLSSQILLLLVWNLRCALC